MNHTLVVYYSRSGFTRKVAEQIARACDGEIEEIEEERSRAGAWGFLRSGIGALLKVLTPIQPAKNNPADFDVVVIGTPVWASNIATPVRTYLDQHEGQFKEVALFCTYGGSGAEKVLSDMKALAGKWPLATLALTDDEIKRGLYVDELEKFATPVSRYAANGFKASA